MQYLASQYLSLPTKPGVYRFLDADGYLLYVGKAKDLKSRVTSYFTSKDLGEKTRLLVSFIKKIEITEVESELESLLLEAYLIKKHRPKYNIRLTDDKSYPLIKITIKDEYPTVLFARKMDNPKASYFGPYPNSGAVKLVLRTLRKAFPYISTLNHPKKICLYNHLELCPCPPVFKSNELKLSYKKDIRNLIRVLEGKSQVVVKELTSEMKKLSENERFEEAEKIKKKIFALHVITEPARKPFEYDLNPNLLSDVRQNELEELKSHLKQNGLDLKSIRRIECYDISNIQGTNSTGSLVVLTNGEIDKSQYRKFKIKIDGKPNDFAMMQEMIERRLNHKEWNSPDLIIVDGGKGQITSALLAMEKKERYFPLIGLAKREETIVIPINQQFYNNSINSQENKDNFIEYLLPKNSPSLHIMQRIRNEAHRFAITYHRKLRSKNSLT